MSGTTQSDNFEHELDEFFKERALFRTQTVADTAKNKVSKERCENLFEKLPDARHASSENAELTDTSMSSSRNEHNNADGAFRTNSMSGCCMTGCYDCPWEYAG